MDEFTAVLKAREFVRRVNPVAIPVLVDNYAAHVGAVVRYDAGLGLEEPGWAFPNGGKHYICVNANDRPERQRFTICHELAHIVLGLTSDHKALPWWSYAKRPIAEILCDVFAAELLLPFDLFKPVAEDITIAMGGLENLAGQFVASLTATGSRFAAVLSAPCAFVLSEDGKVRYASRSTALRAANAWIAPGIVVPRGSASEKVGSGVRRDQTEQVDAEVWFSDWERGGVLLEEARHFPRWNQTLTLLWFEDGEVPQEKRELREGEEELGLEELDGYLRWPSKKRRR